MEATTEEKVNNLKVFRKLVRDHNEKTGFNFALPENTDYSSRYAHPVHDDGVFKIIAQIDDDAVNNHGLYGVRAQIEGISVMIDEKATYEKLKQLTNSKSFKYRLGVQKGLVAVSKELEDKITLNKDRIFQDTITDIEKEENYDLAIRAAKVLYNSPKES